jgi:adenylate cyclase class 2
MNSANQQDDHLEVEIKFHLDEPNTFLEKVKQLGAESIKPRVFERNLRFDTPDGRLRAAREVLRLRQDSRARLTFKGPAQEGQEVAVRSEIEFTVSDFDEANRFLEALGYEVVVIYEKYRSTFLLEDAEITLDEMPFGVFCEIEGRDAAAVVEIARKLGLPWEERIQASYLQLFETIKNRWGLKMRDLTFENFTSFRAAPEDFQVEK